MKKRKPNYWLDCTIDGELTRRLGKFYLIYKWYVRRRFFYANSDEEALKKAKDIIERKALYLKDKNHKVDYAELNRHESGCAYVPVWSKSFKKINEFNKTTKKILVVLK